MRPFSRNRHNTPQTDDVPTITPAPVTDEVFKRHIYSSIDQLGLDKDKLTLVGSAALFLNGVAMGRQPQDLDIVVPAQSMVEIAERGWQTPTGHPATQEHIDSDISRGATSLRVTTPNRYLNADLITRFDPGVSTMETYDADFDKLVDYTVIDGLRVATLLYLLNEYDERNDAKAKIDLGLAKTALASRGVNPRTALKAYRQSKGNR